MLEMLIVGDSILSGKNLPPRATYIQGRSPKHRMPGIEKCDGLITLGYHAMAGTPEAILEHTMSSAFWQNLWINGVPAGEFAIDAGIAGDYNVPTIMVSGDDKVCEEAKNLIKNIVTIEVKRGLDIEGGILLPKEIAPNKIKEGAEKAVKLCKKRAIKPYKVKQPVKMRLELVERGTVPQGPHVKLINARRYEVVGENVEEALKLLVMMSGEI